MRKSRKEAAETRQRIVEGAAAQFRRNGLAQTGLADLMATAGLTHGGFYKHFGSKEQVIEEALTYAASSLVEDIGRTASERGLAAVITEYLSIDHRDDVADGCPFVALGSEMARSSDAVRAAMTAAFAELVDIFARRLEGRTPAAARREAQLMLSTMIGAMTMARAVADPDLSASILRQARTDLSKAAKSTTPK